VVQRSTCTAEQQHNVSFTRTVGNAVV